MVIRNTKNLEKHSFFFQNGLQYACVFHRKILPNLNFTQVNAQVCNLPKLSKYE